MRKRGLGSASVEWRKAPAQRSKFYDGPRETASVGGGCTIEIFEECSNKRGTCPSGSWSYVVVHRGGVRATGPHGDRVGTPDRWLTKEQAKEKSLRRVHGDPALRKRCKL